MNDNNKDYIIVAQSGTGNNTDQWKHLTILID
jgi:hypothetical protein